MSNHDLIIDTESFKIYKDLESGKYYYYTVDFEDEEIYKCEVEVVASLLYDVNHDVAANKDLDGLFECDVCGEHVTDDFIEYLWFNFKDDPEEGDDMVFCEDVTGVLGQMFALDMSGLPEEAVKHLQDAYQICAEYLK